MQRLLKKERKSEGGRDSQAHNGILFTSTITFNAFMVSLSCSLKSIACHIRARECRLPAIFAWKHEHANPQCLHGSRLSNCERSGLRILPTPISSVNASRRRTPLTKKLGRFLDAQVARKIGKVRLEMYVDVSGFE